MKKLSKFTVANSEIMNDSEMKNILGGASGRCDKKGCRYQSDCGVNTCTEWADCPSIAIYGKRRCY